MAEDPFDRLYVALLVVVTGASLTTEWPLVALAFSVLYVAAAATLGGLVLREYGADAVAVVTAAAYLGAAATETATLLGAALGSLPELLLVAGLGGSVYLGRR
jgi:hypothetical protein